MSKSLLELKKELIAYGKLAGEKNFTPGYSGNLSARYGDKILITSSGSANGYLSEDELVLMDFDGNLIDGYKKPSSEKMLLCPRYYNNYHQFLTNFLFSKYNVEPLLFAPSGSGIRSDPFFLNDHLCTVQLFQKI